MQKPNATKSLGIVAIAVVGAQLPGMLGSTQQATANICGDIGSAFTSAWNGQTQSSAKGEPIGSYYDVRSKRNEPYYREGEAPEQEPTPEPTPIPRAVRPAPAPEVAPLAVPPPAPPVGSMMPISANQSEMIQTIHGPMTREEFLWFGRERP